MVLGIAIAIALLIGALTGIGVIAMRGDDGLDAYSDDRGSIPRLVLSGARPGIEAPQAARAEARIAPSGNARQRRKTRRQLARRVAPTLAIVALCSASHACYGPGYGPGVVAPVDTGKAIAAAGCGLCVASCAATCALVGHEARKATEGKESKIADAIDHCTDCAGACLRSCGESLK